MSTFDGDLRDFLKYFGLCIFEQLSRVSKFEAVEFEYRNEMSLNQVWSDAVMLFQSDLKEYHMYSIGRKIGQLLQLSDIGQEKALSGDIQDLFEHLESGNGKRKFIMIFNEIQQLMKLGENGVVIWSHIRNYYKRAKDHAYKLCL